MERNLSRDAKSGMILADLETLIHERKNGCKIRAFAARG